MKLSRDTRERIETIILSTIGGVIIVILFFSLGAVLSEEVRTMINATMSLMWVLGVIFGFLFEPFLKTIFTPNLKKLLSKYAMKGSIFRNYQN